MAGRDIRSQIATTADLTALPQLVSELSKLSRSLNGIAPKLNAINEASTGLGTKLTAIGRGLDSLEGKFGGVSEKFQTLAGSMREVSTEIDRLDPDDVDQRAECHVCARHPIPEQVLQ